MNATSVKPEVIRRLKEAFPDAQLELTDTTGTDDHWDLQIAADGLQGMPRVRQHQAVYRPLRDLIDSNRVHALNIKIFTHDEWNDR